MARCCDKCCFDPPPILRARGVTSPCGAIPVGFEICLTRDDLHAAACPATACGDPAQIHYTWSGFICGIFSTTELNCCPDGCLKSCWQLGSPGRTIIYGLSLDDDTRSCEPFFQRWLARWEGTDDCVGTSFYLEIDELPCSENTDSSGCGSGSGSVSGSGSTSPSGA